MPSANEIRQQFIDFFCQKHGHTFVPSSPVVPFDDPTLLFTNAGMNQFKPYFLGTETPKFRRAANTQKCIRAGGKHNDLDDVGKDTYHHTFFEMLGNWSFGDYFKREAIRWAWELLTDVWKIDKSRLHVTVFLGDPDNNVPRDNEAVEFWKSETDINHKHIHYFGKEDNFWEMGETGPCGPCTEIHIDLTSDKSGRNFVNTGSPKVMEIWNLVFIQFNRNPDQTLTPLPAKHVDTGMGFERIAAVLQGKKSNYDTDVFTPIFAAVQEVTKAPAYGGKLENLKDIAYRVIADHIRTLTFAITDGALPSNEKRGYVLRSVLRRAVRYGWQQFGMKEPFLHSLVPAVVGNFGAVFPELEPSAARVSKILLEEEHSFLRTLANGMKLFTNAAMQAIGRKWAMAQECEFQEAKEATDLVEPNSKVVPYRFVGLKDGCVIESVIPLGPKYSLSQARKDWAYSIPVISAKDAFDLHTEQGLFIEITEQMAAEIDMQVDRTRFDELFAEFKEVSAQGRKKLVVTAIKGELPSTIDDAKYRLAPIQAKVIGWVKDNAVIRTGTLGPGESLALLVDQTNFYGEQGGQVGDSGVIRTDNGAEFDVEDTQRLGDAVLHVGTLSQGRLNIGDAVTLVPAVSRRLNIQRNHTATHLLNLALRKEFGHVEQKGSLVDETKTRFDFSYDRSIGAKELRTIEDRVNRDIMADLAVNAVVMRLGTAKGIPGVRAVFGEKYPDPVRVVMIGPDSAALATPDDSVEFCGGTHVERTGSIGVFKIVSQESVSKGVRRVTAVTARAALAELQDRSATIDSLAAKLQCPPAELSDRVESLQEEIKKLQLQLKKGMAGDLTATVDKLVASAQNVLTAKLVVGAVPAAGADAIRAQVDRLRSKLGSCAIVFGWDDEGKGGLLVAATDDLVKNGMHSGKIVGEAAKLLEGKGGGNPTLAQAGGKSAAKMDEALALATKLIRQSLER